MSEDVATAQPDFDDSMEIIVETLTGTTFEMTVGASDTIFSIKSKIHRVEGIPVSQQHLLYRLEELNNDDKLCDHGITAGCTLRLVLSMRGGPISTRRLASTEHTLAWRELKEYVDNTREDMIDKLPPGSKVTVLLFREGENINLIRVIENEDGTCYPYSDSSLPPAPKTPQKDTSTHSKYRDRSNENNVLMEKLLDLRRKMEELSVHKKTKKPNSSIEESTPESSSSSTSRLNIDTTEDTFRTGSRFTCEDTTDEELRNKLSKIYSDRMLVLEQRRNSHRSNIGRSHRPHRIDTTMPKSDEMSLTSRSCTSIQAPSIAILEEEPESTLNKKESDYSPPSPISVTSGDANTITMSQIPSLPGASRNLLHFPHVVLQETTDRPKTSPDKYDPKAQEFCNVLFNETDRTHHHHQNSVQLSVNRRQSLEFKSGSNPRLDNLELKSSNLSRVQFASGSTSRLDHLNDTRAPENWQYFNSNLLTSQYASTSKLNSAHLDNCLGNRVGETKFNNERRSPLYGRRARIERIRNTAAPENNPDKFGYSNLGYIANIEKIQNDSVSINKPQYGRRSINFVSNLEPRNASNFELRPIKLPRRRIDSNEKSSPAASQESTKPEDRKPPSTTSTNSTTTTLPAIVPKKPAKTRCAFCNKRLNITTIYTCRCGGEFCSQHRYSEVHGCHYDYKTEGRKIIEQANPLVAAPKLPKI